MSSHPQTNAPPTNTDEIDLYELARSLWSSKVLVCTITLLVTAIAAAYAFLSQPVYQSSSQTLPPPASSLASYNAGNQAISNDVEPEQQTRLPVLTSESAYNTFLRHLGSSSSRTRFFESNYLPAMASSDDQVQRDALWQRMAKDIVVTVPSKPGMTVATLSIEGHDPLLIAAWTNEYMQQVLTAAHNELLTNLGTAVEAAKQVVSSQISALRSVAAAERKVQLVRLQDALKIAESVGLEDPPQSGNLITSYSDNNTYLRGARAIRAEIQQLEARTSDDAYILELPELIRQQTLLNTIDVNPTLAVATIDRSALVPEDPIRPRKMLILALGIVLGGMLGVFVALARAMFRRPTA